jgi:hypothetical protein
MVKRRFRHECGVLPDSDDLCTGLGFLATDPLLMTGSIELFSSSDYGPVGTSP